MSSRENIPEFILFLKDTLKHYLIEIANLPNEEAQSIANAATNRVCAVHGGEVTYIPKGTIQFLSERDIKIYHEFRGNNHIQLARKYDLSVQRIYAIVKEVSKSEIAKRQPDLFYGQESET